MSFGHTIEMLKKGYAVARESWNGRGKLNFEFSIVVML
jgi:hypothetical protein